MKSRQLFFLLLISLCCLLVSVFESFANVRSTELTDDEADTKLTNYQESMDTFYVNQPEKTVDQNYYLGNENQNIKVSVLGDSISTFYGYNDYGFIGNFYLTEDDYKEVEVFLVNKRSELAAELKELQEQAISAPSKEIDDRIAEVKKMLDTYDELLKSFYEKCKMNPDETWWMSFINNQNFELAYNDSLGGTCVAWDGICDINRTISAEERINKLGRNGTPDIILIFGGINDVLCQRIDLGQYGQINSAYTVNTFVGAYNIMLDRVKTQYPNAKIVCIIPYDTVYSFIGSNASKLRNDSQTLHDNIVGICKERNIPYIDLKDSNVLNYDTDFTSDYIHLNVNGMKITAQYIEEVLKNDNNFNKPRKAFVNINNNLSSSIDASIKLDVINTNNIEYKWYALDKNNQRIDISDWSKDNDNICWKPEHNGEYKICGMARVKGDVSTTVEANCMANFNGCIKGVCQIPYQGKGGGYLIGIETYDNPSQSYKYEMQILDCTLLAQNKDAWIYSTNKCTVQKGNALWTVWQPQYGYYWTLFRVYDKNDELIDQECYGFVNAY